MADNFDKFIPDWVVGTLTLVSGSRNFTATNAQLSLAAIREGDTIITPGGLVLPIESINSNGNGGVLANNAPAAAAGTYATRIRYQSDNSRFTGTLAALVSRLSSGNLQSLAGLTGAADKGLMFTGPGTAGTFDLPQRGRDLLAGVSPVGLSVAVAANQADARAAIGAFSTSGGTVSGNMSVTGEISSVFVTDISIPNGFRSRIYGEDLSGGRGPSTILNPGAGEFGQAFFIFTYQGNAFIPGALTAGSKSFQIDHPKDPYNKDLVFMSTEAPKAGIEDWGRIRLINGEIEVDLDIAGSLSPGTFAALTQRAMVVSVNNLDGDTPVRAGRIVDGKFKIYAVGNPVCDDEVTWIVKAERADPFIKTHPYCDPETGLLIPEHDKEDA